MQHKTFKYRLYPTAAQEKLLAQVLSVCRHWYNMCLEERKLVWELEHRFVSKAEQEKTGICYRKTFPKAKAVFSQTMQMVCDDIDKAFKAFFRRVQAGAKPGYPRFKGYHHFDSFGFKQYGAGIKVDGRRLKVFGIGRVRVRWHRPTEGTIKTARICRTAGQWFVCFNCELPDPTPLPTTGQQVGVDLNVENLLTDSTNRRVESPKHYGKAQGKLRLAQRSLRRKKQGSKNRRKALRRVQRLHERIKNQRHDLLNKEVHHYITGYDLIAMEGLQIANMVRNHHLSKSILDQGWGYFRERLTAKAANAGRQFVLVNPAYTSQTCSRCGNLFQDVTLSVRWVTCGCGLSLARDHNAALNILYRATGQDVSVNANVGACDHALFRSPRL
ncbi:MAG: transposase [Anaerolineae bacterium]|nr:transposase [Anaerolineae bacterium]